MNEDELEALEVLERVELSESDDEEPYDYAAIDLDDIEDDGVASEDEDLATAISTLKTDAEAVASAMRSDPGEKPVPKKAPSSRRAAGKRGGSALGDAQTQVRPAVVDDFIRNFLIKVGMSRTLDVFNTEWYELMSKGRLNEEYTNAVPDIYLRNQELDEQVVSLREQLKKMGEVTARAQGTWDKFRKERDFHRMHHKRVVQEKNKLVTDIQRLRKHYTSYDPTLKELRSKYEVAMKEKMLMRLERDRIQAKMQSMEEQMRQQGSLPPASAHAHTPQPSAAAGGQQQGASPSQGQRRRRRPQDSRLPPDDSAENPFLEVTFDPAPVDRYQLKKTFRGHMNSVSAVAFHPRKPILATVSDDETWKIWSVPNCDLIMSGEGHSDWVSGVDFHPYGSHLATSGGDNTVKLWDFASASCAHTFTEHTQAVWSCSFHHTGDFLASCSMDQTTRMWDVHTGKCRQTFRGHVDSVNTVCWQPFTNNVCTGSGDKTVSLWDARSGLCIQTFYGHLNACNHVTMNTKGDTIASCDADGVVKLWDVRMVSEIGTLSGNAPQHPLNRVSFDRSANILAAASDDGTIKTFSTETMQLVAELRGHEDAVQCVMFDPADKFMVSASSDCTFRIWS